MNKTKKISTKAMSFLVALVMMIGLIPTLQQDTGAVYTDDNSFRLTLTPLYGNCYMKPEGAGDANSYRKGTESDMSFAGTVYYNDSKEIVYNDSCTGVIMNAIVDKDSIYPTSDVTTYLAWVAQAKTKPNPNIDAYNMYDKGEDHVKMVKGSSLVSTATNFPEFWNISSGDQIIYVNAQFFVNGEKKGELTLSADMTHAKKATSTTIRYKGVGFQIMAVDDHPLGPYNYLATNGNPNGKKENTPYGKGGNGLYVTSLPSGTETFKAFSNIKGDSGYFSNTRITSNELYHMMNTQSSEIGGVYSAISFSAEELSSLFTWVNDVYLQAPELAGSDKQIIKGNTMTLHGPRIICCYYGAEGYSQDNEYSTKYYNLQWYDQKGKESTNPNSYTTWPESLKDGFAEWRFVSFTVPTSNAATLTVNCYDLSKLKSGKSNAESLIYSKTLQSTDKFTNNEQLGRMIANIFGTSVEEQAKYETPGTPQYFISNLKIEAMDTIWGTNFFANSSNTIAKITESNNATSALLEKGTTEWFPVEKGTEKDTVPSQSEKYYQQIHDLYASWITGNVNQMIDSIKHKEVLSGSSPNTIEEARRMFAHIDVDIPTANTLKTLGNNVKGNYVLDHGVLNDAVNMYSVDGYRCTTIMPGTTRVTALGSVLSRSSNLDLYYMPDGDGQYTVKVKIDGEEQPDLERKYTNIPIGTVINKSDVVVPPLPDEAKVKDIENVPLTVDNTPEDNIIIINATKKSEEGTFKVVYYLDGIEKMTDTETGRIGDEVYGPRNLRTFSGYELDSMTGVPFTLKDDFGVIRVYFKSIVPPAAVSSNAQLFTDKNYTKSPPGKYASGYGFFARFTVNVPAWLGEAVIDGKKAVDYQQHSYSYVGSCGPYYTSVTLPTYQEIYVTVTAKWTDGIQNGKISEHGTTITKTPVLDRSHSTRTKLVYRLPDRTDTYEKAAKAYIPVGLKDGSNWGIDFKFHCTYQQLNFVTPVSTGSGCRGHFSLLSGTTYCSPYGIDYRADYHDKQYDVTGRVSLKIDKSMYEDDFTSDKR